MENATGALEAFAVFIGLALVFTVPVVAIAWWSLRATTKATELLRIYADKGEEPPQSVIDAVGRMTWTGESKPKMPQSAPKPPTPPTRGREFSASARDFVVACGAAAIAWVLAPEPGNDPGVLMIVAMVVALISAAGSAWHIVTAINIRDGQ